MKDKIIAAALTEMEIHSLRFTMEDLTLMTFYALFRYKLAQRLKRSTAYWTRRKKYIFSAILFGRF